MAQDEEVTHTISVVEPLTFDLMKALWVAGLQILDLQSGRAFHALINLPAYGLTRQIRPEHPDRAVGFLPTTQKTKPTLQTKDILIDSTEAPYDIEAALFLHGKASWCFEAQVDTQWVLVVTDTINIPIYFELLMPIIQAVPVSLLITPFVESIEKGVPIKLSSIIPPAKD